MLELEYKRKVANALRTMGWDIQEHEDELQLYIPDLSFGAHGIDGWIEVKYKDRMPEGGLSKIKHYTKGQEDWLIHRGRAGSGHCYLLVGTGSGSCTWRWDSLRNARARTYIAAQSLCCCRSTEAGGSVISIATALDNLIRIGRVSPAIAP